MGQVPNDEIFDIYLKSKIYVFPSTVENFPVVLLEAMAASCAVITSTAAGCVEVVGNAAIKAETGCVEVLRRELQFLMNNQQEVHKLGLLGQKRVDNFAWTVVTNRFLKLFENIMAEQKHDRKRHEDQQLVTQQMDNLVELNPVRAEEAVTLTDFDKKRRHSG